MENNSPQNPVNNLNNNSTINNSSNVSNIINGKDFSVSKEPSHAGTVILIILVIIGIFVTVYLDNIKNLYKKVGTTVEPPKDYLSLADQGRTIDLPENKLPDKFPKDFPIEARAKVISNTKYNTINSVSGDTKSDQSQSTREFLSKKTIEENYSIYKNYLNTNKWVLKDSFYQPTMAVISAEKGNLSLFISINKDSTTGQALVGIRITY
jgi:hypothetical protein